MSDSELYVTLHPSVADWLRSSYTDIALMASLPAQPRTPQSYLDCALASVTAQDIGLGLTQGLDDDYVRYPENNYVVSGKVTQIILQQSISLSVTTNLITNVALAGFMRMAEHRRTAARAWLRLIDAPIPIKLAASGRYP